MPITWFNPTVMTPPSPHPAQKAKTTGSDLGGLQRGDVRRSPAEHLPRGGTKAPLISLQAEGLGFLETLGGHPGYPVGEHWRTWE